MMTPPVTPIPYFEEVGSGDICVLMLHGIGGGRHAFAHQMQPVAAAGYQAVAWDMPGYGHSATIDPYTMETLADECLDLIDVLAPMGEATTLVLVGHSMGGMVAQEVAARAPERIAAMVLAGTTAAFGKPEGAWQREFIAARTAPLDAGMAMHELAKKLVAEMVAPGVDATAIAEAVAVMAAVPPQTWRAALAALVGFDRRTDLAALRIPTLVIAGRQDRNAPPEVMEKMAARIAGAQFVCLEDCGHLMNFEKPEAFNSTVLGFLERNLSNSFQRSP